MLELLAKNWGLVLARGIFTVVFGALAVFWPGLTVVALVFLFGFYAILDGITAIVMGAKKSSGRGWVIFIGALGVVAGVVALVWPAITALALLYLIAFWALVIGIDYIVEGVRLKGDGSGRFLLIVSGLAAALLGFLLLINPGEGALAVVFTIGFLAIVWGVVTIVTSVRLRRLSKELQQA